MKKSVIDELRQMFVDGATPSKLMRYISACEDKNSALHSVIMNYFREAFGVTPLRIPPQDNFAEPKFNYPHFNRDVLPEMVRNIAGWNQDDLDSSWLEDLSISSPREHEERLKNATFEALDRVWDDLNDKEKTFIIQKIARKDHYWEVIKTLACLLERLQQKVNDLEDQLENKQGK